MPALQTLSHPSSAFVVRFPQLPCPDGSCVLARTERTSQSRTEAQCAGRQAVPSSQAALEPPQGLVTGSLWQRRQSSTACLLLLPGKINCCSALQQHDSGRAGWRLASCTGHKINGVLLCHECRRAPWHSGRVALDLHL